MKIIVNKFKVPILEKEGQTIPFFFERGLNVNFELKQDHFESKVFNATDEQLKTLKEKYIWISEEEINIGE